MHKLFAWYQERLLDTTVLDAVNKGSTLLAQNLTIGYDSRASSGTF
ncbi:MAG: hypothetical protein KME27_15135 [Lyngbya sp. HA4199-MV5]|jgi:hypothetical protein|nr:hypothetical protein [Lyngbya sp. HA4199-MV5]